MTLPSGETVAPMVPSVPIGQVLSVRGSEALVGLSGEPTSGEKRATVGKFIAIAVGSGYHVIGMITEIAATGGEGQRGVRSATARVDLMGEIRDDPAGGVQFCRGVADYPAIGDPADLVGQNELRLIYKASASAAIHIGQLHQDESIPAYLDVDNLLQKHFAVLGSTGVGKSSAVAVIIRESVAVRPDLRVFVIDCHNEYGRCFDERAHVISPRNLKLPFWLFSFEEFVDVIYGGRPPVDEELEILAELIPVAKNSYTQYKASAADRPLLKKSDPRTAGFTVDTPVPYLMQDLLTLIDERMGRLENRSSRMNYHRLMSRIDAIKSDPRYGFMFENANVGGDTMADLLSMLFRIEPDGKPISIMQLAGLPAEVVDAVVCLLSRLAFDFGLWSDGAIPLLFVCEEAHRYASADRSVGFAPTRRALSRIAKEGRKYGVYLGLVTQRAAELDPTIISQCSTLLAMRMANDRDQALLRSAVSDAAANLLAFVPSLGTGEVVGFGEGVPLPARMTFRALPSRLLPRSEALGEETLTPDRQFVQAIVERWRGASLSSRAKPAEATPAAATAPAANGTVPSPAMSRLDQARYQILRR